MANNILLRLADLIDALNERVGRAVSWLTTLLMLLVCFDVLTRYLMNDTRAWIMELEWHLFALIFLLGAGYGFRHDRHVRVDLFYANFSDRDKALVNCIGGIVFLIPWCLVIAVVGTDYGMVSWRIGETSPDPGGLPARYLIKFSIALGAALLLLQGLSNVIRSAMVLRGVAPAEAGLDDTSGHQTGAA